jgi:hypothetical protein
VALGIVGLITARRLLAQSGGYNVSNVTTTKKEGVTGGTISTTPIKKSDVAYTAPASTLSLLLGTARSALNAVIPSGTDRVPSSSLLTPFQNARSAAAAYNSPVASSAANYRPSSWAGLQTRN